MEDKKQINLEEKDIKIVGKVSWEHYTTPTPVKMRKIGDAILVGTASLSTMIMGLPISDSAKLWTVFALNVVGTIGKVITNFFKEEITETTEAGKSE